MVPWRDSISVSSSLEAISIMSLLNILTAVLCTFMQTYLYPLGIVCHVQDYICVTKHVSSLKPVFFIFQSLPMATCVFLQQCGYGAIAETEAEFLPGPCYGVEKIMALLPNAWIRMTFSQKCVCVCVCVLYDNSYYIYILSVPQRPLC
jgi:hypothetical protein